MCARNGRQPHIQPITTSSEQQQPGDISWCVSGVGLNCVCMCVDRSGLSEGYTGGVCQVDSPDLLRG